MKPEISRVIPFDKEKAREEFIKNNPTWNEKRYAWNRQFRTMNWDKDSILSFVSKYNDPRETLSSIQKFFNITQQECALVASELRKRGVIGKKPRRANFTSKLKALLDTIDFKSNDN